MDLVFCDEYLPDGSYRDLLISGRFGKNAGSFVLLLRVGEWEEYLTAMRLGALDVLRCPLQQTEVEAALHRALALKEQRGGGQGLADGAQDGRLSAEDLQFQELLERAAAALNPKTSATTASSGQKVDQQRAASVRKEGAA
jgi:DNA-binding NtrC family response regulator